MLRYIAIKDVYPVEKVVSYLTFSKVCRNNLIGFRFRQTYILWVSKVIDLWMYNKPDIGTVNTHVREVELLSSTIDEYYDVAVVAYC